MQACPRAIIAPIPTWVEPMAILAGKRLGPYEILSTIGAGGMGEVYRARDPRLKRQVAIKVLPTSFSSDPQRLRRFEQEANAAAALNHPNILAVYDIGQQDGSPYIVSELLDGTTLRERLRSGPLPIRKAVDYAQQVASGLAAAHDKGIIHRDLKPENIVITDDGRVKILDFGLAKLTRSDSPEEGEALTQTVQSEPGTVLGTVGYMSPEQVRGKPTDARSDLFSFGAILYEMLSGKRAFHGESPAETMSAIVKEEPPELSETNRNVPPGLERIVRHCLEKQPHQRFQSASDVAFAVEALTDVSGNNAAARAITGISHKRRLLPASVAVAVALGILVAAVVGFLAGSRGSKPEFQRLTFQEGTIFSARFLPDGHNILYSASWEGQPMSIFSVATGFADSRSLVLPAYLYGISRTGEMALGLNGQLGPHAVFLNATVARAPVSGGSPREILGDVRYADWDPNGNLTVVHEVSGRSRLECPVGKVLYETSGWISYPRFSPSGDKIAFMDHPVWADDRGSIVVIDLKGNRRTLSDGWESEEGLAWSAKGDEVWFTATRAGTSLALHAVSLSGRLRLVLRVPGAVTLHDIAADGRVLLSFDRFRFGMRGFSGDDGKERELTWFDWTTPSNISSNGRFVIFQEAGEPVGANYAVGMRKMDGSPPVRLGEGYSAGLSRDGKWAIAVVPGNPERVVLLPTGAGEPRPLHVVGIEYFEQGLGGGGFLPDGRHIALNGNEAGHSLRAYVIDIETGNARPITPEGVRMAVISEDGKWIAALDVSGRPALYPVDGREPRVIPGLAAGLVPLRWAANGSSMYMWRAAQTTALIYQVDLATGKQQLVREIVPPSPAGIVGLRAVAITPDGRSYVYGYTRLLSDLYVVGGLK